jgi:hypothetical protein
MLELEHLVKQTERKSLSEGQDAGVEMTDQACSNFYPSEKSLTTLSV